MVDSGSFASSHSSSVGFCQNPRVCRAPRHLNRGPLLYSFLHARCWFSRRSENSTTLDSPSKVSSSRPPLVPLLQRHSTSWVACPGSPVAMSLYASNALASSSFCPYSARGVASAGPQALPAKKKIEPISTTDEMNASRATGSCVCTCRNRWRFAFHEWHTATAAANRPSPWMQ